MSTRISFSLDDTLSTVIKKTPSNEVQTKAYSIIFRCRSVVSRIP